LVNGIPQGITAAIQDLEDPANYQVISSILENPITNQLISIAHTMGFTDATDLQSLLNIPSLLGVAQTALSSFDNFPISDATLLSSPTDLINDLSATLSADYATLVPVADTVNALLTSLPSYDLNLFTDQLEAGNLLGAVGDPIAADLALVPFAFGYGAAAPVLEAAAGTFINLVDLIPEL
jgi:hypothetical protein